MLRLSAIVCTRNPRPDHLRRTLDSLAAQSLPKGEWEFILVDNGSDPPLAKTWDLSWHPNARHVFEPEPGVVPARARGMKEAAADLLVFADDDNVLDRTYLALALDIGDKWPSMGVWGSGSIIPEFELEPDESFNSMMPYLALRESARDYWSNVYLCPEATPRGAGMCVRAVVAGAYRRMKEEVVVSRPGITRAGEDNDIAYVACDLGLGMGVFPELRLTHLIPKERVSRVYLLNLVEATEATGALLRYRWTRSSPRSRFHPVELLSFVKNLIVRRGIDRQKYLATMRGISSARKLIVASRHSQKLC